MIEILILFIIDPLTIFSKEIIDRDIRYRKNEKRRNVINEKEKEKKRIVKSEESE